MSVKLFIREGFISEVVALSQQIPEFNQPYPATAYHQKYEDLSHLILVACDDSFLPYWF